MYGLPGASRKDAKASAIELMDKVRIPSAKERVNDYPHQFSGGMRQRVMIAMAIALDPAVLIADEPTTALDVTVQAQILDLLAELRAETGMALLLVSHDFGVVAGSTDEVLVMRDGKTVEHGPVRSILGAPEASYTRELLAAVPRTDTPSGRALVPAAEPLLRVTDLRRHFTVGPPLRRETVRAVDGVTLEVGRGETLGIVGGCRRGGFARSDATYR